MNITYLLLRAIRHRLPEQFVRGLLRRGLFIRPGLETRQPALAVKRYIDTLAEAGVSISGKHVLDFGYGGSLAVAVELLKAGCSHVTVCDHLPTADKMMNNWLLPGNSEFLQMVDGAAAPRMQWITPFHGDIRHLPEGIKLGPFDLIISSSVFEHVDDVEGITAALAKLLKPEGRALAFIDLRDHYFKYPFEMLCYSESVWKNWLNPTSNLNRFRLRDYRRVFEKFFSRNQIQILEQDPQNFRSTRTRIRPEFISGDDDEDAVTQIAIVSNAPITKV